MATNKHDFTWAVAQLRGWGFEVSHGPRRWETTVVDRQPDSVTTQVWPSDQVVAIVEAAQAVRFKNAALRMQERLNDVGIDPLDYVHMVGG